MDEEDKVVIEGLLKLTRMTKYDVKQLEFYIRKYVDKKIHVCGHCAAQMKFAQKRLASWYSIITNTEEVIIEPKIKK